MIDKPEGLTSHDVVARVRRIGGTRRVGHTGTLDPMATGVLVLCLGKATRLIPFIEEAAPLDAKEYEATIRFGFETTTDDAMGEPRGESLPTDALTETAVRSGLAGLTGWLEQIPPAYSAKKVEGERAYAMARRGEEVELKPSRVHVARAELLELSGDAARVRYACSRGTYIRSLARDLGRVLSVGAHLSRLRRTRSVGATIDVALALDDLTPESVLAGLQPLVGILADWPKVRVGEAESADLRLGRAVTTPAGSLESPTRVRLVDGRGQLVALGRLEGRRIQPFCVF